LGHATARGDMLDLSDVANAAALSIAKDGAAASVNAEIRSATRSRRRVEHDGDTRDAWRDPFPAIEVSGW
jgi:hypothetical protein